MTGDRVELKNIKDIDFLAVDFNFSSSPLIVITGKNGVGKTSLAKAFKLISDPQIFDKSAGLNAIRLGSEIGFSLAGFGDFSFSFDEKIGALDTKQAIPSSRKIVSELPVPYGERFSQFSLIASHDAEIRANIASTNYSKAESLIDFLSKIYTSSKFDSLQKTRVGKYEFYFILRDEDYYIREDHFSSGEFFLIQLYRIITSGASLIFVDELDVSLDAAAQVKLYGAIKPLLESTGARLIVVSHSLAFMSTVEDEALYYLERTADGVLLEPRSFGYIKSDLYGFTGFDRYFLTEDTVLEGFIRFIVSAKSIVSFYRFAVIGVCGVNQLQKLAEKNDEIALFGDPRCVACVMDGDTHEEFVNSYNGAAQVIRSPFEDIEKYVFLNRDELLPDIGKPTYKESDKVKAASKSYWKWLTIDNGISSDFIYSRVADSNPSESQKFSDLISEFLNKAVGS